jgi:putative lipoic acid-binding regulatory protein
MITEERADPGKLTFPCQIGIKAMGRQSEQFPGTVKAILAMHVEADAIIEVRIRNSKAGKFLSVTCEVMLQNRQQMEAIYAAMFDHPDILMTL